MSHRSKSEPPISTSKLTEVTGAKKPNLIDNSTSTEASASTHSSSDDSETKFFKSLVKPAESAYNKDKKKNFEASIATSSDLSSNDGTIIREIPEEGEGECTSISGVLRYCKGRILYPYLKLLGIMGLKPLQSEATEICNVSLVLNKMYIAVVILLLLLGYFLQFVTCFRRDRGFDYLPELTGTETFFPISLKDSDGVYHVNATILGDEHTSTTVSPFEPHPFNSFRSICSGSIFYVHILPSLLHFISFLYMMLLYWMNHDEQLQNLMERVFIQATQAHSSFGSQKKVLSTLKFLVIFGCCWLILSTVCIGLQMSYHRIFINLFPYIGLIRSGELKAFYKNVIGSKHFPKTFLSNDGLAMSSSSASKFDHSPRTNFVHFGTHIYYTERQMIVGVMGFSTVWQDAIHLTVIISYCIHCNLLSTYLDFIHSRVSQHSITLSECIREIGELDKLLKYINNELASGMLPLLLLDAILIIGSVSILLEKTLPLQDLIISIIICCLWILLFIVPIVQATKLSSALKKVRDLGHEVRMRPFGYQNYEQADLDSFLLFVSTIKMDVRIVKIPLTATKFSIFVCLIIFTIFIWGYFQ